MTGTREIELKLRLDPTQVEAFEALRAQEGERRPARYRTVYFDAKKRDLARKTPALSALAATPAKKLARKLKLKPVFQVEVERRSWTVKRGDTARVRTQDWQRRGPVLTRARCHRTLRRAFVIRQQSFARQQSGEWRWRSPVPRPRPRTRS
jgi:hypothetical protein